MAMSHIHAMRTPTAAQPVVDRARRLFFALRALTERREAARYRDECGIKGFSPELRAAMFNDPTCPVIKRHEIG